jgi:four helix bundle protein
VRDFYRVKLTIKTGMEYNDYNTKYRNRTKKFAIDIIRFYIDNCKKTEELKIIGRQLLRSGTSVAANFRAFTRGRSEAEKFSKLCIVIEETDETEFWLELIQEAELIETSKLQHITKEANELIKIFSTTRAKMKK